MSGRASYRASCARAIAWCLSLWTACAGADAPAPQDWFHLIKIDGRDTAISEPKYWQENVSYLLVGSKRALLFDSGPGIYSMRTVVGTLTSLPLLVIPSHLHFDHVGRISEFEHIALLDLPALRAEVEAGTFTENASQYMLEGTHAFRVSRWLKDGELIDLGGRTVRIIATPGHTPDSVSLLDASSHRMFTGDLVNRAVTLLNVPGSSLADAAHSVHRLLSHTAPGWVAYEAHAENPLTRDELKVIVGGLDALTSGRVQARSACMGGVPARRYDAGAFAIVIPPGDDRRLNPLKSVTETVDFLDGKPCP